MLGGSGLADGGTGTDMWDLGDASSVCFLPLIHSDQLSGEALSYTETCAP